MTDTNIPEIWEWAEYYCPWCYVAAVRLHKIMPEYEGRVRLVERAFPLEVYAGGPPDRRELELEIWLAALQEPAAVFKPFGADWPTTTLPAFNAAWCGFQQGESIGRDFDLRIRRAFFAEGRNIGKREVMLDLASEANLDMDHFTCLFNSDEPRAVGNESKYSNEVSAVPHLSIGWANLQWPPTMNHTISTVNRTDTAYGQVWIGGATEQPGATEGLLAQLGFGPSGSNPNGNAAWTWVDATFNGNAGNNDEFMASLLPETTGSFDYVYRYSTTNGRDWLYTDLNGPVANNAVPANPGKLTVNPSADTTAPEVPAGLHVLAASPAGIQLAWDVVVGDASLYGYEVLRSVKPGGLSESFPHGSPIIPVAPPTMRISLFPLFIHCTACINPTKFPKCSESAVGSHPRYNVCPHCSYSSKTAS